MHALNLMTIALKALDEKVIGLAKINSSIDLILEIDESADYIVTYKVGSLNGSNTNHLPLSKLNNLIFLFPDNKTLAQMKENPFEFDKFCKSINI